MCKALPLEEAEDFHFEGFGLAAVGVLPQRQVEYCAAPQDGLGVGEFTEAPFAVVGAHAGVAGAVEGNALYHHVEADLVDAAAAVLLGAHHAVGPFHIPGEQIHGERVLAPGDDVHEGIGFGVLEGDDGEERAEELVLNDVLVNGNGVDDGGGVALRLPVRPISGLLMSSFSDAIEQVLLPNSKRIMAVSTNIRIMNYLLTVFVFSWS